MSQSAFRAVLVALLFGFAGNTLAEEAPKPPPPQWTFALHGFAGGSVYAQDALLAPSGGGQALWTSSDRSARNMIFSGDVRQTRLNFSISGPKVLGGATPKGHAEIDFFGGNSSGPFGAESVFPRLRTATADLDWGNDTLMVGQWHSFALGVNTIGAYPPGLPEWTGHAAFPVCLEAGCVGWRFPGLFYFHRMSAGGTKIELAGSVQKSAWANVANPQGAFNPGNTTGFQPGTGIYGNPDYDLGAATGVPALEARIMLASGKAFAAFVSGHWGEINAGGTTSAPLTGTCGATGTGTGPQFCGTHTVYLADVGVMANALGFTFKGHAYYGQNTSALAGEMLQFQATAGGQPTAGLNTDVPEWAGFVQLGYDITPILGIWGLIGTDQPDFNKAYAAYGKSNAVRESQTVGQAMLRLKEGGMSYALEWTHWHTRYPNVSMDGNQYMLSAYYFF